MGIGMTGSKGGNKKNGAPTPCFIPVASARHFSPSASQKACHYDNWNCAGKKLAF